jgi:hypothetical protein
MLWEVETSNVKTKTAAYDLATTAVLYLEKRKSKRELAAKADIYLEQLGEFERLYKAFQERS